MKTKLRLVSVLTITSLLATAAIGTPLTETTAVHVQPAGASPVITYLKAGSEPLPPSTVADVPPAGWMAVSIPGPRDGYVQNKDLMKSLDVKPGAAIYLTPDATAGVVLTAAAGDKFEITGLHGKWTQVRVTKDLTGYIQLKASTYVAASPMTATPGSSSETPAQASANAPSYNANNAAGQPAPMSNGDGGSSLLPRLLQGKFVSSRGFFGGKKPYDWALNDNANERYAYVDITKLLLTEQIDKYIDHTVVVYGTAQNIPGTTDIVITAESIQLK